MPEPRLSYASALSGALCLLAALAVADAFAQSGDPAAPWRALLARPAGPPPSPPDNPLTEEKIALGARLFADVRLSGQGDRSCATCHRPDKAFTDGRRRARAVSGTDLQRNTASLWNLA